MVGSISRFTFQISKKLDWMMEDDGAITKAGKFLGQEPTGDSGLGYRILSFRAGNKVLQSISH